MSKRQSANSCLFGEEIVAYVYDELRLAERSAFEEHLLNCSGCTAELAAISVSRLGVFEWHRDEFVPLATPHFAIPYRPIAETATARISFFDSIRAFASPFRVAFAGGTFAALVFIALYGFLASGGTNSDLVAGNEDAEVPVVSPPVPETQNSPVVASQVSTEVDKKTEVRQYRSVSPATARKATFVQVKATVTRRTAQPVTTSAQNAPRLGTFTEPDDTSLRLSDLVADIDTKD